MFGTAVASDVVVNNSPPTKQALPAELAAQAVTAWLNINF
jgi:hypothetical protein